MIIYLLAESLTIAAVLWAAWNSYRYHRITRNLESVFGKVYSMLLLGTCLWWIVGAYLRFTWAVEGAWKDALHNVWTIKWLGWWFIAGFGNGLRTDMEINASKWEHWRDIMRAEVFLSKSGFRSLIFLIVSAVTIGTLMYFMRS